MADTTKFVQLVESYPCLYNSTLSEYSKKDVTERAWASIGRQMNWTVGDCKEKWKNLRNGFVRSLKPSPSGSSAKAKKPYYLNDVMQFVLPYVRPVQHIENSSNITLPEMEEEFLQEIEISSDYEGEYSEVSPTALGSQHGNNPESHLVNEKHPAALHARAVGTASAKKRKRNQEKDEVDVAVLDYIKAKKGAPSEDPKQMFLLSLLPDVRELSDESLRQFKIRSMLLLEELLNEQRQQSGRRQRSNQAPIYCQNLEVCTPAPSPEDTPSYTSLVYETISDGENEVAFYTNN